MKDPAVRTMDDLHENDILRGYVKACTSCGVFVRYFTALCNIGPRPNSL